MDDGQDIQDRDQFQVGFERAYMRNIFRSIVAMTLTFAAVAGFLTIVRPQATGARTLLLATLYAVSYWMVLLGLVLTWWAGSKLRSRLPAFSVDREGISIYFGYQREMRFTWREIGPPYVSQKGPHSAGLHLCFNVSVEAYRREATFLQSWISRITPSSLSIGLLLLDRPWKEIEDATTALRAEQGMARAEHKERWEEMRARVEANLQRRRTLDGALVTFDDYRERFRLNPIGSWSPAGEGFTQSPVDQDVVFYPDNTGFFTDGPFHSTIPFRWLEKADYEIELEVDGETCVLSYEIRDTQPPSIWFTEEEPGGTLEFNFEPFIFEGLPRHGGLAEATAADSDPR